MVSLSIIESHNCHMLVPESSRFRYSSITPREPDSFSECTRLGILHFYVSKTLVYCQIVNQISVKKHIFLQTRLGECRLYRDMPLFYLHSFHSTSAHFKKLFRLYFYSIITFTEGLRL